MKAIKRRITTVGTTKKIMRAMGMVAASKLQKDKERLDAARLFIAEAKRMLAALPDDASDHAFIKPRSVLNTAYVVITSDRGLCGSYNTNLLLAALQHMDEGRREKIITIGLKGREYLHRLHKNIVRSFIDVLETAFYEDAEGIGRYLAALYTSGQVDEIYVAHNAFESALKQTPQIVKILPLGAELSKITYSREMRHEPAALEYLDHAVPLYLSGTIYAAMLESITGEQAARMVNMDSATQNATDIIDKLGSAYNRKRQAAITQEIGEVVNSASVVK